MSTGNQYKFWVELGEYAGGGTSGGWNSSTDRMFHQVVEAPSPIIAENMIVSQYGGPERCRVSFQGLMVSPTNCDTAHYRAGSVTSYKKHVGEHMQTETKPLESYKDFAVQKRILLEYLQVQIALEDWHGVADLAMDLRELEAEHRSR